MTKVNIPGTSAKTNALLKPKRKRRSKKTSQRKALSEIRKYQQQGKFATSTLIPKSCFARLARKTAESYKWDLRFQDDALLGLQTACEAYIVDLLSNGNKIASSSGRMTLQANDVRLAHSISTGEKFTMLTEEEKKLEKETTKNDEVEDEEDEEVDSDQDSTEEDDDVHYSDDEDSAEDNGEADGVNV